jgi:tRNA 2-thiocytidine biosynthesis protein TtcA
MATALGNVVPSHLQDRNLYPFSTLQAQGVADPGGDRAFDDDEPCAAPTGESVARPSEAAVRWMATG